MKSIAFLLMMFFLISIAAHAAMYQWKDDKGVVNFTDNPDKIPAKYLKRVKKRASISADATETAPAPVREIKQNAPAAKETTIKESGVLYGGHDEDWWRSAFGKLRDEMNTVRERLSVNRKDLEVANRKMTIYPYAQNRKAYYDLLSETEKDEAKLQELNNQLESLENDAARAGVPFSWRK